MNTSKAMQYKNLNVIDDNGTTSIPQFSHLFIPPFQAAFSTSSSRFVLGVKSLPVLSTPAEPGFLLLSGTSHYSGSSYPKGNHTPRCSTSPIKSNPGSGAYRNVPWINLKGHRLEQAGFAVGTPYTIKVYDGKLVCIVAE